MRAKKLATWGKIFKGEHSILPNQATSWKIFSTSAENNEEISLICCRIIMTRTYVLTLLHFLVGLVRDDLKFCNSASGSDNVLKHNDAL